MMVLSIPPFNYYKKISIDKKLRNFCIGDTVLDLFYHSGNIMGDVLVCHQCQGAHKSKPAWENPGFLSQIGIA